MYKMKDNSPMDQWGKYNMGDILQNHLAALNKGYSLALSPRVFTKSENTEEKASYCHLCEGYHYDKDEDKCDIENESDEYLLDSNFYGVSPGIVDHVQGDWK